MKKFLLGFVIGILFVALTGVILVAAAVRFGGSRRPQVVANSALVLQLEGDLPEQSPVDYPIPFLQERAAAHRSPRPGRCCAMPRRIRASRPSCWSRAGSAWAGPSSRSCARTFSILRNPANRFTHSCGAPAPRNTISRTAADQVFMAPEDELDVKGLRAELMFVKGTLDKLGVQMEFEHVGKYKDAPDMFTKNGVQPGNARSDQPAAGSVLRRLRQHHRGGPQEGAGCDARADR